MKGEIYNENKIKNINNSKYYGINSRRRTCASLTVSTPQTAALRKPEQPASQQLWFLPAAPMPAAAQWPF